MARGHLFVQKVAVPRLCSNGFTLLFRLHTYIVNFIITNGNIDAVKHTDVKVYIQRDLKEE